MNRPYCYKSASDAAPNASDSAPRAIFGVFFAVRGSTLRSAFCLQLTLRSGVLRRNLRSEGPSGPQKKGMAETKGLFFLKGTLGGGSDDIIH